MRVLRWLGFLALLGLAAAGFLFALMAAGFSVMAFDAPDSTNHLLPYLIVGGSWLALPASFVLLVLGVRAMTIGRTVRAYALLGVPALLALAFFLWLRTG